MSFLQEQLRKRKQQLLATDTVVTTPTGVRFIEQHASGTRHILNETVYGFVVDTKPDTEVACILDNFLYLGSQDAVCDANLLKYNITHIISVGIDTPSTISALIKTQNIHIPCLDLPETELFNAYGTGIAQQVVQFIAAIQDKSELNAKILVHCNAGVSRSASIVIAYLMIQQHMKFEAAYALVKQKRVCVQPNSGFMEQLQRFSSSK